MLNAVGGAARLTGVEVDRDGDDDRVLGIAEPLGGAGIDVRVRERLLELGDRRSPERRLPFERCCLNRDVRSPGHAEERTGSRDREPGYAAVVGRRQSSAAAPPT